MVVLKKLPDVIGFYLPGDRSQDQDNTVRDPRTGELVTLPTMTKQEFGPECDINNIVRDFTLTGQIQHINERAAQGDYVDLPDAMDYQDAIETARAAQASFDGLPAQVRARFDNDPGKFLEFMGDPANQEEAIRLGLAVDTRPPPETPEKPSIDDPPAA